MEYFSYVFILTALMSFLAGFINSISGGGGIFLVPSLMAFGFPAINALTLNRTVDLGVIVGAIGNYWKVIRETHMLKFVLFFSLLIGVSAFAGSSAISLINENLRTELVLVAGLLATLVMLFKIIPSDRYIIVFIALLFAIGGIVGAKIIVYIPEDIQKILLIGAACLIGLMVIFPPQRLFKKYEKNQKVKEKAGHVLLFMAGAWSGAFAMAGATMGVLVLVFLYGKSYVESRGLELASSVPETLISLSILFYASTIELPELIIAFVSSILGAWVGSKIAIKKGDHTIRIAIAFIGIVMSLKVCIDIIIS